jgi:hypothetical protein
MESSTVTWRVTDSSLKMSGKGSTPELALASLKSKIRLQNSLAGAAYRRIRGQI